MLTNHPSFFQTSKSKILTFSKAERDLICVEEENQKWFSPNSNKLELSLTLILNGYTQIVKMSNRIHHSQQSKLVISKKKFLILSPSADIFTTSFNMCYQENSLRIFPNFPMRKTFDTANIMFNKLKMLQSDSKWKSI